jgi:hypothetical protein
MSNGLVRTTEGAHRDHDAEHRGNNSQTWQRIRHRGQSGDRLIGAAVLNLNIEVQHLVHVEGPYASSPGHTHGVADKAANVKVMNEVRIGVEDHALFRLLDIHLNRQHAGAPDLIQQLEHHLQQGQIALPA